MSFLVTGTAYSTYGPTPSHEASYEIAQNELTDIKNQLAVITQDKLLALGEALLEAGAPWIEGQKIPDPD
jgi:hypothetical protein